MKTRFYSSVRRTGTTHLPFAAYLTDRATGAKFSNTWETKEQARAWLDNAIRILQAKDID